MSTALKSKIEELFENTKNLMSFEKIEPYCNDFNEWVKNYNYSIASLGTLYSRYGLYKKFKTIQLEQCKNALIVPKHDRDGNVVSRELKHYAVVLCGLSDKQWNNRKNLN